MSWPAGSRRWLKTRAAANEQLNSSTYRATVLACGLFSMLLHLNPAPTSRAAQVQGIPNRNIKPRTVTLVMHASDASGNPVSLASLQGIEVTERGQKLQVVSGPQSAGPEQIGLLLDSNFHQEKVLDLEKKTAEALLSHFQQGKARAFVMNYGKEIHISGELTEDWENLRIFNRSIQADTDKRNQTILMLDALRRAMDTLGGGLGTKVIVLFAEGNDGGSSVSLESLVRLAEQNHIACYVVFFADHTFYGTKATRHYGWDLVELVPRTGGEFWEVGSNSRKANKTVQELLREIGSQCVIEVVPSTTRTDRFHRLKLTSSGRRIKAQTGYF